MIFVTFVMRHFCSSADRFTSHICIIDTCFCLNTYISVDWFNLIPSENTARPKMSV
jgi:hypothetical protein